VSDFLQLYQEIILKHNKHPLNYGKQDGFEHSASGHNPLCGDQVTVYWSLEGSRFSDIRFESQGCAISRASASMMTDLLTGKTLEEANELFKDFSLNLNCEGDEREVDEAFGELVALSEVRKYPSRVKCVTLAWHALLEDNR